jgi:hypothetical protein
MIPITDEDRTTPLTVADLKEFCGALTEALAAAPPLQLSPKRGDVVPAQDIIGVHSEDQAEDGRILCLYDLRDGGTGAQVFFPGEVPGPVRYC